MVHQTILCPSIFTFLKQEGKLGQKG